MNSFVTVLLLRIMFVCAISIDVACKSSMESVQSKSFVIIKIDLYQGKGAIVPADYSHTLWDSQMVGRFTPDLAQINQAEALLKDSLKYIPTTYPTDNLEQAIIGLQKDYKIFNRYYIGYTNKRGQKVLNVYLFDYSSRSGRQTFLGWERDVIYSENANFRYFLVNLDERRFEK